MSAFNKSRRPFTMPRSLRVKPDDDSDEKPSRDFGNHVLLITDHGPLNTVSSSRRGRGGGVGRNLGVGLGRRGALDFK